MHAPRKLVSLLAAALTAGCAAPRPSAPAGEPAVVVLISVDQLRADLVTRYAPYYRDGFRRLIEQGAHFDAVHDHGWSETAPGHATLSTGTVPARSGIVANDFMIRENGEWRSTYNVADASSPIVGLPEQEGMSPRNLLRSGVAEWVVQANPSAKVVSVAGKDRAAILMAAHARGDVFWYDTDQRRFITSTYYFDQDPAWLTRFNQEVLPGILDSTWTATAPAGAKALARPDTAAYEGDGTHTFFPHTFAGENRDGQESFGTWVSRTPYPDRATFELAKVAVRETGLGDDDVTDFLALGFSQADRIGHRYGPLSREQLENLMHLDLVLGDLFRFLDEEVGKGRWVAALSADHGATTMPEWDAAHGQPARRLTRADQQQMTQVSQAARESAARGSEAAAAARALAQLPFLAGAYTGEQILAGSRSDSVLRLLHNSHRADRTKADLVRNDVAVVGQPWLYMSTASTGTGHGTPWYHDRSVPLIFLGAGVQPGRRAEIPRTVDLAPTLARLGGIASPNDLDGHVLPVSSSR